MRRRTFQQAYDAFDTALGEGAEAQRAARGPAPEVPGTVRVARLRPRAAPHGPSRRLTVARSSAPRPARIPSRSRQQAGRQRLARRALDRRRRRTASISPGAADGAARGCRAVWTSEKPVGSIHICSPSSRPRTPDWPGSWRAVLARLARRAVVLLVLERLLVGRDVALVVAQHDLVIRVADQVVGHDRDLAAAAGRVDHVGRDGVAARVAAQALHDLEALADRRAEVPAALDQVALVQVVRPDAHLDELVDQLALDVDAVVDACEQDRLIADRDAGAGRACRPRAPPRA